MYLNFSTSTGRQFTIEVGYFDTFLEIKEKVTKYQGIPASKQTLTFMGDVLKDHLNVHYSNIVDRSDIQILIAPEPSKIQLLLKTPMSKLGIALEMDVSDTVAMIKEKIQEREGIHVNRLAIYAKGIELHDHKSLRDCELSDNAEIDVAVWATPKNGAEKVPVEVNSSEYVGELRKKLQEKKLELPEEGYFFIYKQNVMEDDKTFRWHHVCPGDSIEVFGGSVSGIRRILNFRINCSIGIKLKTGLIHHFYRSCVLKPRSL